MSNRLEQVDRELEQLAGELEQELTGNILPYWMKYLPDEKYGGFLGHITHANRAIQSAGKGAVLNARILWTFSAAHRMYGKAAYMETARRAYRYFMDRFMDREFGGVFWELDHTGLVRSSRKQVYALAFAIYALSEYWLSSGDDGALEEAFALFEAVETHALDKERNGYTEAFTREWDPLEDVRLSEKDNNETKTMNTHLHLLEAYANLFRARKDPDVDMALGNLISLFLERFVDMESGHLHLFFDDAWRLRSTLVSFGHDIECSWLLHEAAEVLGKPGLLSGTKEVALKMAAANRKGLDADGGLFYEYFPERREFDTDKHWWPQAEAMVGYLNAYQLSNDLDFARNCLNSWSFIRKNIIDHRMGEWFWSVNKKGTPQKENEKAGFWKCPYHNGRACMEVLRRTGTRK